MMLQGCRTADRAEVVERDRFATPNSLKSHGERNLLSQYLCHNAKVVHAFEANTPFEKLPGTQINVPRLNLHKRPRHRRCPTSRDFVPWRFSDAGRRTAWIASSCRHPKTCTTADPCTPATSNTNRPSHERARAILRRVRLVNACFGLGPCDQSVRQVAIFQSY